MNPDLLEFSIHALATKKIPPHEYEIDLLLKTVLSSLKHTSNSETPPLSQGRRITKEQQESESKLTLSFAS